MRRAARFLAAAALLVLVALALLVLWVRSGEPERAGQMQLPGLEAEVEIVYDSLGVPHIFASSRRDLFFAQGYVHARDRLWQMEVFRRVAEGRLSELFGEATLEADRFLRTLGLSVAAAVAEPALDPDSRAILAAYVDGVNAGIRSLGSPPPPEFLLLRARPEPWRAVHSLGIEKIMAWDLTDYSLGLELAAAWGRLGDSAFQALLPEYPAWGPTIVSDSGAARPGGRRLPAVPPPAESVVRTAIPPPEAARLLAGLGAVRASNSWVVGPERSASGKPILANDMHLGLRAPALWYLVGLHAPGFDVVGMSIPGAPTVVAGHNRGVAWGYTNAYVDDADFFVERVDPADSTRYLTPSGSEPFRIVQEQIAVRGRGARVELVVRRTRHGPIVTSVEARAGGELLAFRWTGHDPADTFRALFELNRAASAQDVVEALRHFRNPHQNVVFADTAGAYGFWLAGRVPLRRSGRPPLLPVPGWTGEHDWIGDLPFERHPHVLDPPEGFVVTANNRQSRDSVSNLITERWAEPYRALRIRELITAVRAHDTESVREMQLDVRSAFAARYRGAALQAFRAAGLEAAADTLAAWGLDASAESRGAALFYTWIGSLRRAARLRLYGEDEGFFPLYALTAFLDPGGPAVDSLGTEAARRAESLAGGRRWGDLHRLEIRHDLGDIPVVGRLFGFSLGPHPREGSLFTVNVAEYSEFEPPYRVRSGPSQRHVVDLADMDGAGGFILPGGQSGFSYDGHYADQLERWRTGRLWRLPLARTAVERIASARLRLLPEEAPRPHPRQRASPGDAGRNRARLFLLGAPCEADASTVSVRHRTSGREHSRDTSARSARRRPDPTLPRAGATARICALAWLYHTELREVH
ncbi:MAG: penicillin acylase family protein [Gemmatimonadetes bacterium]|nr:penicillin acylase family protein [Gemmatimonadota bacterium]